MLGKRPPWGGLFCIWTNFGPRSLAERSQILAEISTTLAFCEAKLRHRDKHPILLAGLLVDFLIGLGKFQPPSHLRLRQPPLRGSRPHSIALAGQRDPTNRALARST